MVISGWFLGQVCLAQEPVIPVENADMATESYSDEFQEHFFEALKQKGIENYDKAVDELLKCKKLEPDNDVVDYELGRNYKELKAYDKAEASLLAAVEKKPELWYLDALFGVYESRGETDKAIAVALKLAESNSTYKENLVRIYIDSRRYEEALELIEELDVRLGSSGEREQQKLWIESRMSPGESAAFGNTGEDEKKDPSTEGAGDLEGIYRNIENARQQRNHPEVLESATEALEIYPSQPGLYYHRGYALNRMKRYKEAIASLQEALDYLIDDKVLENNIYREFVIAYNGMGDHRKAGEYAGKIKD